jgi:hypothetical protein
MLGRAAIIAMACVGLLACTKPTTAQKVAEAPPAPQKFDLHCVGTRLSTVSGEETTEAYDETILVDLDGGTFCRFGCNRPALNTINRLEPGRIVLIDDHGGLTQYLSVNRLNGDLFESARTRSGSLDMTMSAKCEKRPFSGYPKAQF